MKFSGKAHSQTKLTGKLLLKTQDPSPDSDLQARKNTPRVTARRRPRTPVTRLKKNGAQVGKRSRPETPLLEWKIHDSGKNEGNPFGVGEEDDRSVEECGKRGGSRKGKKERDVVVSARKLAAVMWRMQLPEMDMASEGRHSRLQSNDDRLALQHGVDHVNFPVQFRCNPKDYASDTKNLSHSPRSVFGNKDTLFTKIDPAFKLPNTAMEGATKWDPVYFKTSDEANQICSQIKLADQKISVVSIVSALEVELEQARIRIQELETERKSSKKKLEHFFRKVNEERATWRSREHEKIRAYIDDMKNELNRERKNRQRLEIVNSRLVNELTDAKLSAKRYVQDYQNERKARELIEEVCDELAKEIGEDKADIEALKKESMKFKEEVEEERKMLQMAEVWREERVQMKLVDAKVALEEKYSQMNRLVQDLENCLMSINGNADPKDVREAEILRQTAASVDIQDIKGFSYEPPNSDDIFSIFEDPNSCEPQEREIELCEDHHSTASHASKVRMVNPDIHHITKETNQRIPNTYADDNGDIEDESGWETVSQLEDQGSSYSPEGSAPSVSKNNRVLGAGSGLDWEDKTGQDSPITEISEASSGTGKQSKKISSISRFWRTFSNNGENYNIISIDGLNGRLSNAGILTPDKGCGKGGNNQTNLMEQWSSPESVNSVRGKKGCIPRNTQKNSLKSKLFEARMESQKIQLRHVLKHKF